MTERMDFNQMSAAELGSMLHALLFAYEKVFLTFFGKEETNKMFSYLIEELIPILYDENKKIINKDLSFEENIKRFEYFLSNKAFLKGLKIERIDDNKFVIEIKECEFAKEGIHDILDMKGGSCPWALITAAVLTSVESEEKYFDVCESEFTKEGSKTILELK